ncbi:MAG: alpha/beta hydrolase [Bacteroidales bacterium]|nr:alpha/beta hydrolase [Bacteroidales bacterium]
MKHRIFEFKGKKINYRDEGNGEQTLVLLHGYMNSLDVWQYFILEYMNAFRVIAVDLIGHGESEIVEDISTMELQAEMIKSLLDKLEIKHCVMCGHSMGGMITLAFAEMYPEMLKGYCLMDSQALADSEKGKQNRLRTVELINDDRIRFIVDFIPNLFALDNRIRYVADIENLKAIALNTKKEGIVAAQKGMIYRKDRCDVLKRSNCPVLFVTGKKDIRIDLETLLAQACLPSDSEVMILDCGHMAFIEEELKVKMRLRDFTNYCFAI